METSESSWEGLLLDTEQAIEAMRECPPKVPVDHIPRDIELSRDLVGLESVETVQDENGAPSRRKLRNGLAQHREASLDLEAIIRRSRFGRNRERLDRRS